MLIGALILTILAIAAVANHQQRELPRNDERCATGEFVVYEPREDRTYASAKAKHARHDAKDLPEVAQPSVACSLK